MYNISTNLKENAASKNFSIISCLFVAAERCLSSRFLATGHVIMSQYKIGDSLNFVATFSFGRSLIAVVQF
jgi:hypothetical protein